jgi:hypothetical protein
MMRIAPAVFLALLATLGSARVIARGSCDLQGPPEPLGDVVRGIRESATSIQSIIKNDAAAVEIDWPTVSSSSDFQVADVTRHTVSSSSAS